MVAAIGEEIERGLLGQLCVFRGCSAVKGIGCGGAAVAACCGAAGAEVYAGRIRPRAAVRALRGSVFRADLRSTQYASAFQRRRNVFAAGAICFRSAAERGGAVWVLGYRRDPRFGGVEKLAMGTAGFDRSGMVCDYIAALFLPDVHACGAQPPHVLGQRCLGAGGSGGADGVPFPD